MVTMTNSEILDIKDIPVYLNGKHKEKGKRKQDAHSTDSRIMIDLENESLNLRDTVNRVERKLIIKVLEDCGGNKTKAGEILGIPRQTLKYKMDKLGIDDPE